MDYIKIPNGLSLDMLRKEFGYPAVDWYLARIEERRELGHKYFNPLKTVYIWATQDRKTGQGFYSTYAGRGRRKKLRNHGRS